MSVSGVIFAWLRNDLRVHDSPVLHRAAQLAKQRGTAALPVYVFDPRQFRRTRYGTLKTGAFRALFLLQSVRNLKKRLRSLGSDLLVKVGKPEIILPELIGEGSVLVTSEEVTSEELNVDQRLRAALKGSEWEYCWGSTLFHRDDLPFRKDLKDVPDVFTVFKNKVEPELAAPVNEVPDSFKDQKKMNSSMNVRACLPDMQPGELGSLPRNLGNSLDVVPEWQDLPFPEEVAAPETDERAAMIFEGGEDAALARLQHYLFDTDLIARYFEIRNGMLGPDYSTKLAPWLALGCVSPRKVFEQVREYEKHNVSNKSTYWVLFELTWRDFYRFFAAKHGDAIFKEYGVAGRQREWKDTYGHMFDAWSQGRTGYPLVDANMRELSSTGFMSNRGRQNVASFLVLSLGSDWRRGADWFESFLLDYDVASNWGNWVHAAGLSTGRIMHFNVIKQSKQYDSEGEYIRHWLPELRNVPKEFIHEPWKMSKELQERYKAETYPVPCIDPALFQQAQAQGKGKGYGKKRSSMR